MTLHLAKGRAALTYKFPFPEVQSGIGWTGTMRVWDAAGTLVPIATLDTYDITARAYRDQIYYPGIAPVATAVVTKPFDGVLQWSFADAAFAREMTDALRFIVDAELGGITQRLVDSPLPVRGLSSGSWNDYGC